MPLTASSHLPFTKMHGLGNDFMVLDATRAPIQLSKEQIRQMADRHFGVGFDQLLMVEAPPTPEVDFGYRIFNADGSEVEQCGNGARCFASFVHRKGLSSKNPLKVATCAGVIELLLGADGLVRVQMGVPKTEAKNIPFIASGNAIRYRLIVADELLNIAVVNMGNPHAVLQVDDIDTAPVDTLGPLIESNAHFPDRVNVGFMQVITPNHIRMRVYERGTGETLACGTGACAAVVAGRRSGLLSEKVKVQLPGGDLHIEWEGSGTPVFMRGPAVMLYDGDWLLA